MGYLDQVLSLKKEGKSDEEITKILSEKGVSPKDINEALKQAEIKSAISEFGKDDDLQPSMMDGEEPEEPSIPIPPSQEEKKNKGVELEKEPIQINPLEISQKEFSIPLNTQNPYIPNPEYNLYDQQSPENIPQEMYTQDPYYNQFSQPPYNGEMTEQAPYPYNYNMNDYQGDYSQESPYPYNQQNIDQAYIQSDQERENFNTEGMIDIANQIFSEKTKKIQKQIDSQDEEINLLKSRLELINERLKRIENTIDKLQISILGKVGSYGENLESIKKEMNLMQDSFSKFVSRK